MKGTDESNIELAAVVTNPEDAGVVTALGLFLTVGFMVFDALQIELPHNWVGNQIWGIGMVLGRPADCIARFLGIWGTGTFPTWGFRILVLSVNGTLGFAIGTILGYLVTIAKRSQNRRNL
jgi:hypothetical protein